MKPHRVRSAEPNPTRAGVMLIECIVYIAIVLVIFGVAFSLFYTCSDNYVGLRRNAEDITAVLHAGERWREDVRRAVAPVDHWQSESGPTMFIPQTHSDVYYLFSDASVWRFSSSNSPAEKVLSRVHLSSMRTDLREYVSACSWGVELKPRRKGPRVTPAFHFVAVPQTREIQ